MRRILAAFVLLTLSCGEKLPRYVDVEDLRVLAIKARPPEVLVDGLALVTGAAVPVDATFEALVLDPAGGEVSYSWSFCPLDSSRACRDYSDLRDNAAEHLAETSGDLGLPGVLPLTATDVQRIVGEMDRIRGESETGTALPVPEAERPQPLYWWSERGVWPHAVPPFVVSAPRELAELHFRNNLFGAGSGAWVSALLDLQGNGRSLTVQKRLVLNVADLAAIAAPLAADFGYDVCQGTTDDPPDCLAFKDVEQNANPVFEAVQFAYGESSNVDRWYDLAIAPDGRVAGVLVLPAGEAVRIKPVFTAESSQAYQVLKTNLQTQQIIVDDRVEAISVSWFISDGEIQDQITWPLFTKSLDTAYFAPDKAGRVTVWMVARDQRGGTEWMSVEIEVAK